MKILPVFHEKPGGGHLTQFYLPVGDVTYLGITQDRESHFKFVMAEGGNISYMLEEQGVAEYLDLNNVIRTIPLGFHATAIIGKIFIVTGTGKYFKNVTDDLETNLGIVRIAADGQTAELL